MRKKLSLIAAAALAAGSLHADAFDIEDMLKSGSFSGDFVLYGQRLNIKNAPNESYTMGSVGLGYQSENYKGFELGLGFRANGKISEKNNGYDDSDQPSALLHTATLSYVHDLVALHVGRQALDLVWASDYHESIVAHYFGLPDTLVTLAYSRKIAIADVDAPLEKFTRFNEKKGGWVLDVVYEGIEHVALNPYYYYANNVAKWYGLKADGELGAFGATLHGAKSHEEIGSNGYFWHGEARASFYDVGLSAGYMRAGKKAGAGSMGTLGENVNPFEEGNLVFDENAKTYYAALEYAFRDFTFGALYGKTKAVDEKQKELNLSAGYSVNDALSFEAIFADVNSNDNANDYKKFSLNATYAF